MKFTKSIVSTAIALALSAAVLPAQATIIYNLDRTAVAFTPAPYGTVTLNDSVTGVITVTVDLFNGFRFVDTGGPSGENGHHAFVFNLDSLGSYVLSLINPTTGFTPYSGSFTQPGFGTYNRWYDCTACGNGGSSPVPPPLVFSVAGAGITVNSFIANSSGFLFSADVVNRNGLTGAIANGSTTTSVPEPGTLALLGLGLAGLGFIRRRKV